MSGRSTTFTFIGKDQFSKVAGQIERKAGGMSGKLGKVGRVAAVGMAAMATATVAAGVALADMAKSAAEDEASQVKLATVLRNTTKATDEQVAKVEEWISAQGQATGIADDKMRPALSRLLASTNDVAEAQALMKVAMDASTATGKPLETVVNALGRAHDGNVGALGRLGIATKDAQGKTLSFEDAVKGMNRTFGGATAKAADTVQGKFGRLSLMFDETKEAIGARMLPVLDKLGGWLLTKGIPALRRFGEKIMPKVREVWDGLKRTIDENRPGLEKFGRLILAVGKFIADKVLPVMIEWYGFIGKNLLKVIAKLGDILPPIVAGYLRGLAGIVRGFRQFYEAGLTAMSGLLTVAEKTLGWIPGIGDKIKAAKAGFESFRESSTSKLKSVESALRSAAKVVDEVGAKAKNMPGANLKANITDLMSKLATAREKLKDPTLTAERKSQIKADIKQLEREVARAKREMNGIHDKTVTVYATIKWSKSAQNVMRQPGFQWGAGRAEGGIVRGPGTGTSDTAGVYALSNGEYVMRASAVRRYGQRFFDALNSERVVAPQSGGGAAATSAPAPAAPVTVQLVLDGRVIQQSIINYERSTGRPVLMSA